MIRLIVLAAASSIALTGAASAADLYVAGGQKDGADIPPAIWTGFYAGINGGYAFDALGSHGGVVDEGGFGGFQLGYNWQGALGLGPNVVLGAEAECGAGRRGRFRSCRHRPHGQR